MSFLFFSKQFLTDEHKKYIRNDRKKFVSSKVINYNDNFYEIVDFEKGLRVNDKEDEIIKALEEVEIFDPDIDLIQNGGYKGSYMIKRNYDYDSISTVLKRYMNEKDRYFSSIQRSKIEYRMKPPAEYLDQREERLKIVKPDYTEEDFEKYVVLGFPIPTTLGKKAKDSARRAYKEINGLLKANVHDLKYFITLTFANKSEQKKHEELNNMRNEEEENIQFRYVNGKDFESAKKAYSNFMDEMRKLIKIKGTKFKYITVWELQRNGNYHFHILMNSIPSDITYIIPKWLDYDYTKDRYYNGKGLKLWKYGKSDVQEVRSPKKLSTYVSKYIVKSFLNVNEKSYNDYLNKKKYFASRNLEKPLKAYVDNEIEFENIISQYELDDLESYYSSVINPYNKGEIDYTIYSNIN